MRDQLRRLLQESKQHVSPRLIVVFLIVLLSGSVILIGYAVIASSHVSTIAEIRHLLTTSGSYAPVVFVLIQILQVVFAPIPGQALASVGGVLFGGFNGAVYSLIGITIGSSLVFVAADRYGCGLAKYMTSEAHVEQFIDFGDENGIVTLFVFFLLPTFPDDLLCVIAGLWNIRYRVFLVILIVGRSPSFILASYVGTSIDDGSYATASIILSVVGIVMLLTYYRRTWVYNRPNSS